MHWFQGKTGLARDRFVSSLYFNWLGVAGDLGPDISQLMNGVMALFAAKFPAGQGPTLGNTAVESIFSPFATFESDHVSVYDMAAPLKTPPIQTLSRIENQPALNQAHRAAPDEVACCLSFEGVPAAGVNQQRRRGRIFLGPLSYEAIGTVGVEEVSRPSAVLATAILTALTAAQTQWGPKWEWVVNSPKTGRQSTVAVNRAWVDNAWDTQRRRGVDPSEKTYWGI